MFGMGGNPKQPVSVMDKIIRIKIIAYLLFINYYSSFFG